MNKIAYSVENLFEAMTESFPNWVAVAGEEKGRSEIHLARKDGASLWVHTGRNPNHWVIKASYDAQGAYNFLPYQQYWPEMNCSKFKRPMQVVEEIERRVLIPFEPMFQDVLAKMAHKEAHRLTSYLNAMRLSPLVCYDEPRPTNDGYEYGMSDTIARHGDNGVYVRVRVTGDRIKIELDTVTIGQAECILRIAQDLQPFPVWGGTQVHGSLRSGNQNWDCACNVCKKHRAHVHPGRTHEDYWDCECDTDYIHPKAQETCDVCRATRDDQPDSIVGEVEEMLASREFQFVEVTVADAVAVAIAQETEG